LFWHESEEQNARAYLRQTLWQLHKALGGEFLLTDKIEIAINPGIDYLLDVDQLTQPAAPWRHSGKILAPSNLEYDRFLSNTQDDSDGALFLMR
jgi:DNA-binding SARP family transcriptional activator